MGPCPVLTLVLFIARRRPPDAGRPKRPGIWRVESGKQLSKTATPKPRAQSAGYGHAVPGLLELVRLLARQAAREQDGARSPWIEESNDDEAVGARRASFDH